MSDKNVIRNKGKWLSKVLVILFAVLIILFPQPSFIGAKNGLLLWFNNVLPTLLPFMIISNLIISMDIASILGKILYPVFRFVFRVSPSGCYPILVGFLSGIPVGAKAIADLLERNDIDIDEGQYLLSFCNNASPMFVMSFIAITQLEQPSLRFYLLLINFLSGFVGGVLYFIIGGKVKNCLFSLARVFKTSNDELTNKKNYNIHTLELADDYLNNKSGLSFEISMLDNAIMESFEVITKVGGYIILFSIPSQIISSSPSLSPFVKIISIGLLEITTGINYISSTSLNENIKIVLIMGITAFGGLSALAQTNSVINTTRLSIGTYLKNKIIQMIIAIVLIIIII